MDQNHKRTHSKVESDPALEKDSEAKRPSREVSNHPSGQPAPSDCASELSLSTDDVLAHISFDDLKTVFQNVLADADAGSIAKRELLGHAGKALAHSRAQAEKECKAIIDGAERSYGRVMDAAYGLKGMATSDMVPGAMEQYLPRLTALLEQGPLVRGPELAWEAVQGVCECATHEWDGGEPRFQEGEEECDGFHERVDDLLLAICHAQEDQGNTAWLGPERVEDVRKLQQLPQRPCTYRYPKTLKFLGSEATPNPNRRRWHR